MLFSEFNVISEPLVKFQFYKSNVTVTDTIFEQWIIV